MSYLRQPIYVYSDGALVFFDGHAVPIEWFDAVVMMRFAQLSPAERDQATAKAIEYGEMGADALRDAVGAETLMHEVFRNVFGEREDDDPSEAA